MGGIYQGNQILLNVYKVYDNVHSAPSVYIYDTSNGKIKKAVSGYAVTGISGKYVLLSDVEYLSGNNYSYMWGFYLGKINSSGKITITKTLKKSMALMESDKFTGNVAVIGNKVYGAYYPNVNTSKKWKTSSLEINKDSNVKKFNKVVIYRCNIDGTGYKKLATITNKAGIFMGKITNKYCVYRTGNLNSGYEYYQYTFSTKKNQKISAEYITAEYFGY